MQSLLARAQHTGITAVELSATRSILIRTISIHLGNASPPYLKHGTLAESYTDKPLVSVNGEAMFAELAIARLVSYDGWDAVWADTAHNRTFWRAMPNKSNPVLLPPSIRAKYDAIVAENDGKATGFFDVIAWCGNEIAFLDYHQPGAVEKKHQRRWIEAALDCGVQPSDLWFVERAP